MELKDWLNSINQTKRNLIDEDPTIEKDYPPYIINRCYSGHLDAVMYANEMNKYNFLPKKMQYDFFINILRTKKRFSPWLRKDTIKDIVLCHGSSPLGLPLYHGLSQISTQIT